jgi:hypothetical protein
MNTKKPAINASKLTSPGQFAAQNAVPAVRPRHRHVDAIPPIGDEWL